jgi:hypothetical protein
MATGIVVPGGAARGPVALWTALLAGPAAASLQLSVNYALVKWACAAGGSWVLAVLATAGLLIAIGGAVLGAIQLLGTRGDDPVGRIWSADSRYLLAATAVGVDTLVAIFFINTLIAIATLSPCE